MSKHSSNHSHHLPLLMKRPSVKYYVFKTEKFFVLLFANIYNLFKDPDDCYDGETVY